MTLSALQSKLKSQCKITRLAVVLVLMRKGASASYLAYASSTGNLAQAHSAGYLALAFTYARLA